ncbi:MAG TPA: hypothetical protein VK277_14740 [Acidimicrobiales bacterium]|nr:hypothetical protein [Acidimicrobiales bacterium]
MAEVAGGPGLTLGQAALLAGAYRWIELRLFELTGSWAVEVPVPEVQVHLDQVSQQHAWHAELWEERLPVLSGVDPASFVRPLGPAVEPLFAELAEGAVPDEDVDELAGGRGVVQRLAGLYRVATPRLLASYDRHLARATPVADGPTIRALRLVVADELAAWQQGECLLQGLLRRPHDAAAAAAACERLESLVVASGAGPGLVPWPDGEGPGA